MHKMQNIYDIRKEKNLYYILPKNKDMSVGDKTIRASKTIVVVNLYYEETLPFCWRYINRIPESISVIVISSASDILEKSRKYAKREISFLEKENRGRDISAFLVCAREQILHMDYVCFVHDKRAHHFYLKEDTQLWLENLWENTLATPEYIANVLDVFETHKEIGLLVPPEPKGEFIRSWYYDPWFRNFENTGALLQSLGVEADLDSTKPVFTIGTVFWAQTAALEALLSRTWRYEDFPEEPLPCDGTVSHAIERSFGYAAQSAGYLTGTVTTDAYAGRLLLSVQEDMRGIFSNFEPMGYPNLHLIKTARKREEELGKFAKKFSGISIYGAGVYGKIALKMCRALGVEVKRFIVSTGKRTENMIEGLPVVEIQELKGSEETGIVIAVNLDKLEAVKKELETRCFTNIMYIF